MDKNKYIENLMKLNPNMSLETAIKDWERTEEFQASELRRYESGDYRSWRDIDGIDESL